jgi:hypothetical protein
MFTAALIGALLAGLDGPVSFPELESVLDGSLDSVGTGPGYLLRGRFLAARIRPGMTEDQVGAVLEGTLEVWEDNKVLERSYIPLGVRIRYAPARVNGLDGFVVREVQPTALCEILASCLPDFLQRP